MFLNPIITLIFFLINIAILYFVIYQAVKRAIEENLINMEDSIKRAVRDVLKEQKNENNDN
ncbi:hypothetical protein [Caloramator sp. Dgby_cultured_2]|uniref:hypothetical protein n=1 Tax=Caloramator sp. Dgby_cultured_2 TaxID=3029174 RepID=UPI00237DD70D|nr:hypothetical protein [Caloramator sp. Dgby_cultured_2]WDU82463.1 hypothetical protein PWK10_12590 [Caloramator sp. Dgby_cultured_2]